MPSKPTIKISLLFLLLSGFLFFPMLSGKVVLANWDRTMMGLPSHIFASRMIKSGCFPLWNPFLLCGYNYCGSGQFHLFNPLYLLSYLCPQGWLLHIFVFLAYAKFSLAGIFTYLFVNKLIKARFWAVVSGVMYMFSGSSIAMLTLVDMGTYHAMFLFPLLLYLALLLSEENKVITWIIFSSTVAFIFLGGVLHACLFALGITITFFMWHSFFLPVPGNSARAVFMFRQSLIVVSGAIVGFLIASIRLYPFLYAFSASSRSDITSHAGLVNWINDTAVPALGTLRLIMPEFFGHRLSGGYFMWDGPGKHLNHIEAFMHYVSIAGLALAYLGITRFNRKALIWALFILGMVLFAVNSPLSYSIERFILHGRRVLLCRFSLMLPMCLAVLAGYGGAYLQESPWRALKMFWYGFMPVTLAISVFCYFKYPQLSTIRILNYDVSLQLLSVLYLLFFLFIVLSLSLLYRFSKVSKKVLMALFFVFLFLDILVVARIDSNDSQEFMSYAPLYLQTLPISDKIAGGVPVYEYRVYSGGGRFDFKGNGVFSFSLAAITGLHDVTGGEAFCYKRYAEFMKYPDEPYFRGIYNLRVSAKQAALLGIKNDLYLALPRVKLYDKYLIVPEKEALKTLLSEDFDPHDAVILEEEPGLAGYRGEKQNSGVARIINYRCNSVEIETSADHKSILLLLDRNEEGWRAAVDGKKTKIYFADYIWRAVVVPAGTHRVRFSYFPPMLARGLILSGIGVIILIIAIMRVFAKDKYAYGK